MFVKHGDESHGSLESVKDHLSNKQKVKGLKNDQLHVPTPAYAPKGNAYSHHFQCQPPDESLHL